MATLNKIESILQRGISLHDQDINNWALSKEQALSAIDEFEQLGIPILGGDILEIIDGKPRHNYDNWFCDPQFGEALQEFTNRSIARSREYITSYSNTSGRETVFVLVAEMPLQWARE